MAYQVSHRFFYLKCYEKILFPKCKAEVDKSFKWQEQAQEICQNLLRWKFRNNYFKTRVCVVLRGRRLVPEYDRTTHMLIKQTHKIEPIKEPHKTWQSNCLRYILILQVKEVKYSDIRSYSRFIYFLFFYFQILPNQTNYSLKSLFIRFISLFLYKEKFLAEF